MYQVYNSPAADLKRDSLVLGGLALIISYSWYTEKQQTLLRDMKELDQDMRDISREHRKKRSSCAQNKFQRKRQCKNLGIEYQAVRLQYNQKNNQYRQLQNNPRHCEKIMKFGLSFLGLMGASIFNHITCGRNIYVNK
jgi:hypothetical protein